MTIHLLLMINELSLLTNRRYLSLMTNHLSLMINELSLMTIHLSLITNSTFLQEWLSIVVATSIHQNQQLGLKLNNVLS